ncbi:helix-turn-helix domain-containing protein [Vagococcus salmoninarum]|uniref:HTH cro/C1-type domain-containing protein n=1 Tax=Vagococcus salmoninarum TaxID=2739 RepID=A0A429ZWF5_9ENTE|nr:helix-turn-helix transcriptional regulator [Vagococcus salmoninarum]RST97995.1 hypothetical protein CBF35_01515 [Vagococcus salmoninarum]
MAKYPKMIELGKYIKELRGKEVSNEELASYLGVSKSFISDLENANKMNPRIEILEKIARFFTIGDPGAFQYIYINLLERAGYTKERNELAHALTEEQHETSKVIPLHEFINGIDESWTAPLKDGEFITTYMNSEHSQIRGNFYGYDNFNDLERILKYDYQRQTKTKGGFDSYGNTSLYYKGKKLTSQDREKISKILDVLFDE